MDKIRQEATRLYSEGRTQREISAALGLHRSLTSNLLRGLPSRAEALRKLNAAQQRNIKTLRAHFSVKEISGMFGVDQSVVYRVLKAERGTP